MSRFCVVAEIGSRRIVSSKTVVHEFTTESGRGPKQEGLNTKKQGNLKSPEKNMLGKLMRKRTVDEIIEILKEHEEELRRYGIKRIGLFGSYVRGEEREDSDLDLLVEFEGSAEMGLLKFVKIENFLSDILGVKVDLVEKSALKPRIGRRILKEVIYI